MNIDVAAVAQLANTVFAATRQEARGGGLHAEGACDRSCCFS